MKRKSEGVLVFAVLLTGLLIGFTQDAAQGQERGPLTVSLTGTIFPADTKGIEGGVAILKAFFQKDEWTFKVDKAENIYDAVMTSTAIVGNLGNRLQLKEGQPGVLDPLQNVDAAGKPVAITGTLDRSTGFMTVLKVDAGQ